MAISNEEIARLVQGGLVKKPERIFSGGTFSDVLDVLQIPQFAATGLLSGKGIKRGIVERATPAKELGLKGVGGFAADVLLDPLTFTGVGALTKAGGAGRAATLAGQAGKGQRALLTAFGQPVVRGKPVFEAITKGAEAAKQTKIGGSLAKAFRLSPATGGKTLEAIEEGAKNFKKTRTAQFRSKSIERLADQRAVQVGKILDKNLKNLEKSGVLKAADKPLITRAVVDTLSGIKPVTKLPKTVSDIVNNLVDVVKEQGERRAKAGAPLLEGKVVPLIPTSESLDAIGKERLAGLTRKFAGPDPSALATTHFKLGNTIVKGEKDLSVAREIAKGKGRTFNKIGDDYYQGALSPEASSVAKRINSLGEPIKNVDDVDRALLGTGQVLSPKVRSELEGIMIAPLKRVAAQADEVNQALETAGKALRFTEDPVKIIPELIRRTGKSEAKKRFVTDVSSVGLPIPKDGIPEGFARSTLKELKDVIFPKPLVDHIDATYKAFSRIDEVNDFVRMYDKIQNTWKGLATFVNPAFHSRNFVSNLWQGFLGGVHNPAHYVRAGAIQAKVSRATARGDDLAKVLSPDEFKAWSEFTQEGAGGVGWIGVDIETEIQRNQNIFFRAGGSVGQYLEDNAKLGLFMQRRAKGMKPAEAAAEVRKFFFDYSDLSDFERNIMKRIFPFYTWTRNNIPLQVAMLIQKPGKFVSIAKLKDAIESSTEDKPLDQKFVPTWMKEAYPLFFGKNAEGLHKYFTLEGFLPSVDLKNVFEPIQTGIELTSPFIKAPFELAGNRNLFFDREIEEFPGQTREIAGFNIPVNSAYFVQQIRPVMELDRLLDDKLSLQERLVRFTFGAKFRTLNQAKQKAIFDYLKSLEQSKIKKQIERERKTGNIKAIPNLREIQRKTRTEFEL